MVLEKPKVTCVEFHMYCFDRKRCCASFLLSRCLPILFATPVPSAQCNHLIQPVTNAARSRLRRHESTRIAALWPATSLPETGPFCQPVSSKPPTTCELRAVVCGYKPVSDVICGVDSRMIWKDRVPSCVPLPLPIQPVCER
jgi:hypothetical protein